MTFIAFLHGYILGSDLMRDKNTVIDLGMTFDTPDAPEVGGLIRKPVVFLYDIDLFPFGQDPEVIKVRMAVQADRI